MAERGGAVGRTDAAALLSRHFDALSGHAVGYFEEQAGFRFASPPEGVPRPLTTRSAAWEVRLFLYRELGLREAFSGDGTLYTAEGAPAGEEWLALNCDVDAELVDVGALLRAPGPPAGGAPATAPAPAPLPTPAMSGTYGDIDAGAPAPEGVTAMAGLAGAAGVCVLVAVAWLLLRKDRS